jgi:hypothetical protein
MPKYYKKILLGTLNEKIIENWYFKPITGKERRDRTDNDIKVSAANVVTL